MKTTLLVLLVVCAATEAQVDPYEPEQTADCNSSLAVTVGSLTEKVANLNDQMLDELKNINQATPKVAFSATLYGAGKGNTVAARNTPLHFKKVFSNYGNCYNSSTGIFTASVKGFYFFHFTMKVSNFANSAVSLMKNNALVVSASDSNVLKSEDQGSNAAVLFLEVGDTVYVQLHAARAVYDDANHYNTFTGFLLFTV